jgi:hypothetical protein
MTERLWRVLACAAVVAGFAVACESEPLRGAWRAYKKLRVAHKRRKRREAREGAGR